MYGQLILITLAATQLLSSPTLPSSLFQHSTSVVILQPIRGEDWVT